MKKILIGSGSVLAFCSPLLAFADFKPDYVTSLISGGLAIVRNLVIFLVSLAVVWFIWNVVKYAMSDEEDGKEKAKSQMIHGIIAIAVITSIWGLVTLLQDAFVGGTGGTAPTTIGNMIPGGYVDINKAVVPSDSSLYPPLEKPKLFGN